jgi:hypothetical protein
LIDKLAREDHVRTQQRRFDAYVDFLTKSMRVYSSPHRHHPPAPDHRARPNHPFRPTDTAATTHHLALGASLATLFTASHPPPPP